MKLACSTDYLVHSELAHLLSNIFHFLTQRKVGISVCSAHSLTRWSCTSNYLRTVRGGLFHRNLQVVGREEPTHVLLRTLHKALQTYEETQWLLTEWKHQCITPSEALLTFSSWWANLSFFLHLRLPALRTKAVKSPTHIHELMSHSFDF